MWWSDQFPSHPWGADLYEVLHLALAGTALRAAGAHLLSIAVILLQGKRETKWLAPNYLMNSRTGALAQGPDFRDLSQSLPDTHSRLGATGAGLALSRWKNIDQKKTFLRPNPHLKSIHLWDVNLECLSKSGRVSVRDACCSGPHTSPCPLWVPCHSWPLPSRREGPFNPLLSGVLDSLSFLESLIWQSHAHTPYSERNGFVGLVMWPRGSSSSPSLSLFT